MEAPMRLLITFIVFTLYFLFLLHRHHSIDRVQRTRTSNLPRVFVSGFEGGSGESIRLHTILRLLNDGYEIVVVDHMIDTYGENGKGKPVKIQRIEEMAGRYVEYYSINFLNEANLQFLFQVAGPFDSVLHFAASNKNEKQTHPFKYYYGQNVVGSINLLNIMNTTGCKRLIYSSVVADGAEKLPQAGVEDFLSRKTNHIVEDIIQDLCLTDPDWKVIALRNSVRSKLQDHQKMTDFGGSKLHDAESGKEVNSGSGFLEDNKDDSGHNHVKDLSMGHLAAMKKLHKSDMDGFNTYNLGSHQDSSVMNAFETALQREVIALSKREEGMKFCFSDSNFAVCDKTERLTKWE